MEIWKWKRIRVRTKDRQAIKNVSPEIHGCENNCIDTEIENRHDVKIINLN